MSLQDTTNMIVNGTADMKAHEKPFLPVEARPDTEKRQNGKLEPKTILNEAAKKLETISLHPEANDGDNERDVTPKSTPARMVSVSGSGESFPAMSPTPEYPEFMSTVDPYAMTSPNLPPTRRTSNAGASASVVVSSAQADLRLPGLRRRLTRADSYTTTAASESATVYSEATRNRLNEDDRRLEQFVLDNESPKSKPQTAEQIPTELPETLKHGSYSFVCSFGWVGDEEVDLEETPLSRESYIEKLEDAKDGIDFVEKAVINYQNEINSRGHHKFRSDFLQHQNTACIQTLDQLGEIKEHVDEVIEEINSFLGDDEVELKERLTMAYKHALPWVKRTRRLVSEAHIFYKLNYVLGRKTVKATKGKERSKPMLPTIPAGRLVSNANSKTPGQGGL
jgi:regulator of replication initiation timing